MTAPVFLAAGDLALAEFTFAARRGVTRRRTPAAGRRTARLTDGAGAVAECVVLPPARTRSGVEVLRRYDVPAPRPRLVVVQGLPKGDRGELAVEMMTEVGVDVIVPWAAARCVTQWKGERAAKALARWRSTAREAGKQSRRLPPARGARTGHHREGRRAARAAALRVVLHEEAAARSPTCRCPRRRHRRRWSAPRAGSPTEEIAAFREAGAVPALLGPTVLRTSTAGVAAVAVLQTRTGRW